MSASILVLLTTHATADCYPTRWVHDIDMVGADVGKGPLHRPNPESCCELCQQTPGCEVWTWNTHAEKCYPKRAGGRPTARPGDITGFTSDFARAEVDYLAKQANRTNTLHPSRTFYPDVVNTPIASTKGLAQWHGAHAPGSWTSGFWPGVNWQLSFLRGEASWASVARAYATGLAPTQHNNRTHDVGFMMYYSYGLGYSSHPPLRDQYGPIIFNTALSLAQRFNAAVGCTESWNPGRHCNTRSAHSDTECNFTVIIDNMMNLEILYYAALNVSQEHCGGCTQAQRDHLLSVANAHATTTAAHHVRADASVHHIVCYDPNTGVPLFACNGGGYLDNTTWARGQAWALYGYTMVYRYTGDTKHLATATRLADFFVGRMSTSFPDHVPNFDLTYDGLGPLSNRTYRDSSAAAIAASGLAELIRYTSDLHRKARYLTYVNSAITALSNSYRSDFEAQEGAIIHSNARDVDVPWSDYYLLEAINRLT